MYVFALLVLLAVFGFALFSRYSLNDLGKPILFFVGAFLLLMIIGGQLQKFQFTSHADNGDYVMTVPKVNASYSLPVEINGASYTGLIDTGATSIAIPFEIAENAGLNPSDLNFNIPISTANGNTTAAIATLPELRLTDDLLFQDIVISVAREGDLGVILLGTDFLKLTSQYTVSSGVMELRFPR